MAFPESGKSRGVAGRIAYGMANVSMAEVVLDKAGIRSSLRQLVTAGMAQHMRVSMRCRPCVYAGGSDNSVGLLTGKRGTASRYKQRIGFLRAFPGGA